MSEMKEMNTSLLLNEPLFTMPAKFAQSLQQNH